MAKARKTLVSIETDVWWVLGTRPGGLYYNRDHPDDVFGLLKDATPFETESAAHEALCYVKKPLMAPTNQKLHVIRVSRTTRESCDG